ncbi:MAG: endonuclease III [Planctomycetaceae bacterium]|nr:endonuclease III [Planctomycetaceae bacterium]
MKKKAASRKKAASGNPAAAPKSTAQKKVAPKKAASGKRPTKAKRATSGPASKRVSDAERNEQKKRASAVIRKLKQLFPVAECALHHESAYQLLVATILSAQCTDERVNQSTPELFRRYPDAAALAAARIEDVEEIVKPLGFFRNKAKNIKGMAMKLVDEFDGEIPLDIDQMVTLPGVGRKTASVVLGTWYGIPSGVVVDTHVRRISNLLGLTGSQNPDVIERELMEILPKKEWIEYSHRIIYHGRATCIARRPQCADCGLLKLCPRVGLPPLEESSDS